MPFKYPGSNVFLEPWKIKYLSECKGGRASANMGGGKIRNYWDAFGDQGKVEQVHLTRDETGCRSMK
jgi:hypothetical protein